MVYDIISHCSQVNGAAVTEYGMAIYRRGVLFRVIEDLSTDYGATQKLIDILNEENPDIVHIDDIVEDFCIAHP